VVNFDHNHNITSLLLTTQKLCA